MRPIHIPLKLALTYAALAAGWIVVTDRFTALLSGSFGSWINTTKGFLFVAVTATLLYLCLRRLQFAAEQQNIALREAHDRYQASSRRYATLSVTNRRIIQLTSAEALRTAVCEALIDPGGFVAAWVAVIEPAANRVKRIASAGPKPPENVSLLGPTSNDLEDAIREAILQRSPTSKQTLTRSGGPIGEFGEKCGAKAGVVVPFLDAETRQMLLVVLAPEAGAFVPETIAMLEELLGDLEHGLKVAAERDHRIAVEAALRASEERYRLLAENSQDVIWILSPAGKLRYISPSIERLLGYTPAQLTELRFDQYMTALSHQRVQDELSAMHREHRETGRIERRALEIEQIRIDGTTIWTEVHTAQLNDDQGRWIGLLGDTRDITDRRAAAQALASENARCRALLDASLDGIHITDLSGQLVDANEVFLQERGFSRAMMHSLHIANWDAKFTRAEIRTRLANFSTEPTLFETVHRRADGMTFPVEIWAKRMEMGGRSVFYCTARDVTERKGLEQRLLRAQRLESVGLIASGIAHDLNNVLTPILLSTGLLEMRYNAPDDKALLDPIEAAARRGSNIVQQILTFARGAEGQRVAIAPKVLLKELSTLIRETFPRNISHRLELAPDARSLMGDPTQLHQVFLNLAVNARDAMPDGGVLTIDVRNRTITEDDVRAVPSAHPGDYVCISIADTGSGMTPEVLDHLFEPFFTTKPRGRGTGLGLSTVHGLVKSHGGFVDVSSRLGHGAEFRVFLPAASEHATTAPIVPPIERKQFGHGEYVLVADDEPAILTVAESVLKRHGFRVLTAVDGQEALNLFHQHAAKIALVITDVMMPNFDGARLAAEVRVFNTRVPIIAMSGLVDPTAGASDGRQQLRALGISTIIDKPYGEPELLCAIEAALYPK